MTCGRARDNACRGDDRGVQQRVDGCDDTQQKGARGGEGCRDASQDDEQRDPYCRFRLEAKEHRKTKYLFLIL